MAGAAKSRTVKKKVVATASRTSTAKKGKAASRTRGKQSAAAQRTRRAAPRGQTEPTPERYMQIQQALAERGFYDGSIDGSWDATCVAALKRFQAEQNLAPDGKLGALSLIALGLGPKRDTQQFLTKPEPVQ